MNGGNRQTSHEGRTSSPQGFSAIFSLQHQDEKKVNIVPRHMMGDHLPCSRSLSDIGNREKSDAHIWLRINDRHMMKGSDTPQIWSFR